MNTPGDQDPSAPAAEGSRDAHASSNRTEDTNLWTTVKKYLLDPQNTVEPRVSCPICMVEIAIRGVPGLEPDAHKLAAGEEQRVANVLVCGHIICQECLRMHIFSQVEATGMNGPRTCPCCRADLSFRECRHLIPGKRVPIATGENAYIVPMTRPELAAAGSSLAETCFQCVEHRAQQHVNHSLDSIAELTHGLTQVDDLEEFERVGEGFLETIRNYVARITSGPSWLHLSPSDLNLDVAFINDERLGDSAKKSTDDGVDVIVDIKMEVVTTAVWSVPLWREQH